jgi:hypothetical protein
MPNFKRVIIVPYNMASQGAKNLAQSLQNRLNIPVLRVGIKSTKYQPRWTDYVINWGNSKEWPWINKTPKEGNQKACNKLIFFEASNAYNKLNGKQLINIPEWTTQATIATAWNKPFFARTILNGHSGAGIVEYEAGEVPVNAPLYVQYKKKKQEFRVHVFKDGHTYKVIDVTQKKKRKGFENVNTKIRNHKNGWVYAREDIIEPQDLRTQALNTCWCLDLTFAAVDLIYNEYENKCYVLEVNTAPGIDGTTLEKYTEAFIEDINK